MKIYITGEAAISPQGSSSWVSSPEKPVNGILSCIEPDYSLHLDPRATRRMSRVMKMGLSSAIMCLKNANVEKPDAILTATGLGCLEDTVAFLSKLSHEDGQMLNPTAFIQSTHNTVGGAIALQLKCNSYNNTFSQRGFSFESALTEAFLLFNDNQANTILVGGIDEAVEQANQVQKQLRNLKHSNENMVALGEGASFLMLSTQPSANAIELANFKTYYKPTVDELKQAFESLVNQNGFPDLVLLGSNGSVSDDKHYQWIIPMLKDTPTIKYKELCGEYPTAPAYAHGLAYSLLASEQPALNAPKSILIYNHFEGRNHSFTLLSK